MQRLICYFFLFFSIFAYSAEENGQSHLSINANVRLRYENLHNPFVPSTEQKQYALVSKTNITSTFHTNNWQSTIELMDSRLLTHSVDAPIGVDDVNTVEPLQFKVAWTNNPSDHELFTLAFGRMTMDIGSRRFVARNRFRNTVNSFLGIHGAYRYKDKTITSFVVKPMEIRPVAVFENKNARVTDVVSDDLLAGVHYSVSTSDDAELYGFYSQKGQAERRVTIGGRIKQLLSDNSSVAYELEGAYQLGTIQQQEIIVSNVEAEISAFFLHASVDIPLSTAFHSILKLHGDIASGDDASTVDKNENFDTLYGAQRFEFGPSGIYGILKRSNLISPGVRVMFELSANSNGFIGYRYSEPFNSENDTSEHVHQVEARIRHHFAQQSTTLEIGGALLSRRAELNDNNTTYLYTQITRSF